MKKLVMMASLAMTCAALPAFAASEADCQAMWKKADANNDGVLSEQESLQYSAMMRVHDKNLPADGKLTQAAFMEASLAVGSEDFTADFTDVPCRTWEVFQDRRSRPFV